MVTKELLDFVRMQLSQGSNREIITNMLLSQGWAVSDVEEAFKAAAPVAPPNPAPAIAAAPVFQKGPVLNQNQAAPFGNSSASASMQSAAPAMNLQAAVNQIPGVNQAAATPSGAVNPYAGFWRRFVALAADSFILSVIFGAILAAVGASVETTPSWLSLIFGLVGVLYYVVLESSSLQGTIGKKIVGIKVTTLDGNRISFLRSLGRYFAKILSAAILMVGYLMAAFTARKQGLHDMIAGTLVVKSRETGAGRIIGTFIAIVILSSALGAVASKYAGAKLFGGLSLGSFSKTEVSRSRASGQNAEDMRSTYKVPVALNEAGYAAHLSKPLTGVEAKYRGVYTNAGPAFVTYDPTTGLAVVLPVIPNAALGDNNYVDITRILDASGKDINDATSSFNTSLFFKRLELRYDSDPVPHLYGYRSLTLAKDAKTESISEIDGNLFLNLPLDIRTIDFGASDVGQSKSFGSTTVTLRSVVGNDVNFNYKGDYEAFVTATAYDASGNLLELSGTSIEAATGSRQVDADGTYTFDGPVAKVSFAVASGILTKSYPISIIVKK